MSDIMTLIQAAYAIPSGAVLDGNRIQNAVEGSDRTTSIFPAEMSVELRAEWNAILGYTRLPHMDQSGRANVMLTSDVVVPVSATIRATSRRRSRRIAVSSAENGSSSRSTDGSIASARASATRCCWPPESWWG